MSGGVKFTGRHWFESHNHIVFRKDFEVNDESYGEFLEEAMDRCGEPYGFWQNIGIKIATVFGLKKNIFSSATGESNRSELIYNFKELVDLMLPDLDADLITPKDIVEACRKA